MVKMIATANRKECGFVALYALKCKTHLEITLGLIKLITQQVPILSQLDTREIVMTLREQGTTWGSLVRADSEEQAKQKADKLILEGKSQNPQLARGCDLQRSL
jgi:carbamoylphosphate synthase small subunit